MNFLATIFFCGVLCRLFYWFSLELTDGRLLDFPVYYRAVSDFLSKRDPYFYNYFENRHFGEIPFNYPPPALFGFLPFKLFPLFCAEIIFTGISLFSILFVIYFLIKVFSVKFSWQTYFLISSLFLLTDPVEMTLRIGQVNLIVLGLIFLSLFFYNKKNKFLVILFLVWSFSLKFYPILILPLFLIKKDYFIFFVSLAMFIVLNVLLFPSLFVEFAMRVLPEIANNDLITGVGDQSFYMFLMRLTGDSFLSKISLFTLTSIAILIIYKKWSRTKRCELSLIFFVSIMMAIASISGFFSWQHQLVFSFPLILILFLHFDRRKKRLSIFKQVVGFACFVSLWLIFFFHTSNIQLIEPINPFLVSYQTIAILIIIMVALVKRKSICSNIINL